MNLQLLVGDVRETLPTLPAQSVQTCVTSPPYFGLRSYMPDLVQVRSDLTDEERDFLELELTKLGITPI